MAEYSKKSNNKNTTEETQQPKRCFVIMPFSDPEGYAPGHFRKVYEQIIKPAVENAGYEAYRVDENSVSDLITTKIFKAILDCDMAVCDLSSRNPNVLYELGIRHAFDKPVVLIKDNKTDRIFDIQGISTIEYRRERLYDEVIEDQKKISEAITANENNSSGYSILNIVNLQKATYDSSIKDPNSPEINNVLLMRIANALEKNEQLQGNANEKIYNEAHALKTQFVREMQKTDKLQEEIDIYRVMVNELSDKINLSSSNIPFDDLKKIEYRATDLKRKITKLKSDISITVKQVMVLDYILNEVEIILDKIKILKQDELKNLK